MKSTTVRGAALVATTALAATLAYAPTASAAALPAVSGADPSPAAVGATYLAAQPGADGLITSYYVYNNTQGSYEDVGLSIDAALALDAAGGQAGILARIENGVAGHVNDYTEPDGAPYVSAGATAKTAVLAQTLGASAASFGGVDLITRLADRVGANGRISDSYDTNDPYAGDYANTIGQAYAAQALTKAANAKAGVATSYLLQQQCPAGYFRASFPASGAGDTQCTTDTAGQGADTTALVILALQGQKTQSNVAPALSRATAWLSSHQAENGASTDGSSANANSTGLAGWALGVSGQTLFANRAAGWLRARQLADAGACAPYAAKDNGALTLDDLGYKNASSGPFDDIDNSTATRATAQALPALLWAPGGAKAGQTDVTPIKDYRFVKAGSKQAVTLTGAPGDTLCVTQGTTHTRVVLPAGGSVEFPVTIPDTNASTTISTVDAGGEADSYAYDVLGEKKLRLHAAKRLHRGGTAKVSVKGLAPKEKVRVLLGKKIVRRGHANQNGVFTRHIPVNHKTGRVTLKVLGQFGGLRNDATKVRVVR